MHVYECTIYSFHKKKYVQFVLPIILLCTMTSNMCCCMHFDLQYVLWPNLKHKFKSWIVSNDKDIFLF